MEELDAGSAADVRIEVHRDSGAPVIEVVGEIDLSNAARLDAAVVSATSAHPRQLVFDLRGLSYLDSAGIAVLLGAAASVDTVQLREPSMAVRRVLELTGLSDVLPMVP
jgi:anti-sigma B factor antagonist